MRLGCWIKRYLLGCLGLADAASARRLSVARSRSATDVTLCTNDHETNDQVKFRLQGSYEIVPSLSRTSGRIQDQQERSRGRRGVVAGAKLWHGGRHVLPRQSSAVYKPRGYRFARVAGPLSARGPYSGSRFMIPSGSSFEAYGRAGFAGLVRTGRPVAALRSQPSSQARQNTLLGTQGLDDRNTPRRCASAPSARMIYATFSNGMCSAWCS